MPTVQTPLCRTVFVSMLQGTSCIRAAVDLREAVGAAKVVFRSGPVDGGKLRVAINEELHFPLTEPAVRKLGPGQEGAHVTPLPFNTFQDRMHRRGSTSYG